MAVDFEPNKEISDPAPTSLHLFRYRGSVLDEVASHYQVGVQNFALTERITAAADKVDKLFQEKEDRLRESVANIAQERKIVRSSETCSMVYLKMLDELGPSGLSEGQIYDFFRVCLEANTSVDRFNQKGAKKTVFRPQQHGIFTAEFTVSHNYDRFMWPAPEWFKGDKQDWEEFFVSHANFMLYLHPEALDAITSMNGLPAKGAARYSERTIPEGFPDWLTEKDGPPDRAEVERELELDQAQKQALEQTLESLQSQFNYLRTTMREKQMKANDKLTHELRSLFPLVKNFADIIIVLRSQIDFFTGGGPTGNKFVISLNNKTASLDDFIKSGIATIAGKSAGMNQPEILALWFEHILKDTKAGTVTQPFSAEFAEGLSILIRNPNVEAANLPPELGSLRDNNKESFRALFYELKPFIAVLPEEDRAFLGELLEDTKGESCEGWIWALADMIAQRHGEEKLDSSVKEIYKKAPEMHKFIVKWLKQNLNWSYSALTDYIQSEKAREAGDGQAETEGSQVFEVNDDSSHISEIQELEEEIENSSKSPLEGWKIMYTTNKTLDEGHFEDIPGETLEEVTDNLDLFIRRNGIVNTVPARRVVGELEEVLKLPPITEQTGAYEIINGVRFHKRGTHTMRVFYVLDRENRSIVFFLHKKRDYHYRDLRGRTLN